MTQLQLQSLMRARISDWLDVVCFWPSPTLYLTSEHYGELVMYEENVYFVPYMLTDEETEALRKIWHGVEGPEGLRNEGVPLTWDDLLIRAPYEAPYPASDTYKASMFILTNFTPIWTSNGSAVIPILERSQCSGT